MTSWMLWIRDSLNRARRWQGSEGRLKQMKSTFKTPILSVMCYTNLRREASLGRELLVSTADPIEEWWTWSEKDYVLTSSNLTTFPTRIQATDTCQKRTEVDKTPIELCKSSTGHRSDALDHGSRQPTGPRWPDPLSRAKTAAWLRTITIMPAVFAGDLPPLLSSKLTTLQIEVGVKCPCLSSIPRRKVTIILWLSTMILRWRLIIRLPSC